MRRVWRLQPQHALHQADAQLEVLKYPVMGVEVRKHGFKDTAPASYKIEKLVGSSKFTSGLVFIELTLC